MIPLDQCKVDLYYGCVAYSYDNLNRLITAQTAPPPCTLNACAAPCLACSPFGQAFLSWSYDDFGNYQGESLSGLTPLQIYQASYTYTGNSLQNGLQLRGLQTNQIDGFNYDSSGNLLTDAFGNNFSYDAEGRLAVAAFVTYTYDADGRRVSKQQPQLLANSPTQPNLISNIYLLGLGGEQVTELDGNGNWIHTNVYAGGKQLATYDNFGTHFQFTDWLGTHRAQGDAIGQTEETCQSLPFGDTLQCFDAFGNSTNIGQTPEATEHHFTGKERDAESGLDYFGARYYASNMGRFMSPDWASNPTAVPYATYANPQSLNLYNYMRNNPLGGTDPDGHWPDCNICSQISSKVSAVVNNPRVQLAGKAALNIAVAGVKITEAAAGAAAAPETGGLTLAVTVYQGISAAGNLAAAGSQLAGAISGDVKAGQTGADVASAATTVSGVATLVATGGDVEKASQAASIENMATTGITAGDLNKGSVGQVVTKGLDASQTMYEGGKATHDIVKPQPKEQNDKKQ